MKSIPGKRAILTDLTRVFCTFGKHYSNHKRPLLLAGFTLLLSICVASLLPWPLKLILDHVIPGNPLPDSLETLNPLFADRQEFLLLSLALLLVLFSALGGVLSYLNAFLVSITGDRMVAEIRERFFSHLQKLSLSFHCTARSGRLLHLATEDTKSLKKLLISTPYDIVESLGIVVVYCSLLLLVNWQLSLVAFVLLVPFYILTSSFQTRLSRVVKTMKKHQRRLTATLAQSMSTMVMTQAYGQEKNEFDRYTRENEESLNSKICSHRLQSSHSFASGALTSLSTAGILYLGGSFALSERISPGTLVLFLAYLREIFAAMEKLAGTSLTLLRPLESGKRLTQVLDHEMSVQDDPAAVEAPLFRGKIEFKEVGFSYDDGHPILKDLSFVLEPGETMALVGKSGVGKSTLISLLLRLQDPDEGSILIDDRDIRHYSRTSLRSRMTILLQNAPLFHQSVKENIKFGSTDATEEEIVTASTRAQAHEFILSMKEQYNSMIEEGGTNRSGGERQRINIARAIIRNTPIVLLDEPGRGLDATVERKVHRALAELLSGKSGIIIGHQPSTLALASSVLFLQKDQAYCHGSHLQLFEQNAEYRSFHTPERITTQNQ